MAQDAVDGVYNLGSGVGHSVNQVKSLVEEVTGVRIATVSRPGRGVDVRSVVLDVSRLQARLAALPSTSLREGIARTWVWLRGQP
jgi:UDP-glucose 4-epimerase